MFNQQITHDENLKGTPVVYFSLRRISQILDQGTSYQAVIAVKVSSINLYFQVRNCYHPQGILNAEVCTCIIRNGDTPVWSVARAWDCKYGLERRDPPDMRMAPWQLILDPTNLTDPRRSLRCNISVMRSLKCTFPCTSYHR